MPDGDPYARMAALMRRQSGAEGVKMRLGTVAQKEPLEVVTAGFRLPTEALKINERLTKGASWKTRTASPNGRFGRLTGNSGEFRLLPSPVTGVLICDGEGCAPQLTALTSGTLNSGNVLIEQGELDLNVELDEAEHRQLELDLEVGDKVLMLTEDDQVFYILMKVVDAV